MIFIFFALRYPEMYLPIAKHSDISYILKALTNRNHKIAKNKPSAQTMDGSTSISESS